MKVLLAERVPEALGLLAGDGAAIPVAGGTDLLVHWPVRVEAHDRTYVDLSRLEDLKPPRWSDRELVLGGLTTYWDVIQDEWRGREEVPLDRFYTGYKEMRRRADQLVVAIRFPRRPYSYQVFEKVGSRRAQAIAKVGLAVTRSDAGWRVVAASMAPTIRRCPAIERLLEVRTPLRAPDDLLPAIASDVAPIDDLRSTAEYRRRVMARVLYDDLRGPCGWR